MGIFSKPSRWLKKQTHGGLSAKGLLSSAKGHMRATAKPTKLIGKVWSFVDPVTGGVITGLGEAQDKFGHGETNVGKILGAGAKAGVKAGVMGKAGKVIGGKIGGMFKGGGGSGSTVSGGGDLLGDIDPNMAGGNIGDAFSQGGRFRKIAGAVGDFVGGKDGFGMDDLISGGKALGDAYGAYTGAKDQDRYRQLAEQNYAANAPLRDAGRAMLMDNSTPDLSSVFNDPTNPQGRYRKVNVGSRGAV